MTLRCSRVSLPRTAGPNVIGLAILLGLSACKSPTASIPARSPSPQAAPKPPPKSEAKPKENAQEIPIRADKTVFGESELMGTRVSINVYVGDAPNGNAAGQAITAAFHEIARIESIASEWIAQSELSRLSASAGQGWQSLSPEMWELLNKSVGISKATDGHFDITFYSVGRLWDFSKGAKLPDPEKIKAALKKVGHRWIELDPAQQRARLTQKGVALGMGAIAKGYGVDRAAKVLKEAGLRNFIVEAGGDTYVSGKKGDAPWRVGIQNPSGPGPMGSLEVLDRAVVTSGNYERFFVHDGVHYTHILDPKTGYPILRDRSPRSVTVVARNATDADAYCTALAVMGTHKALAFVKSRPDLEAIIVDAKGNTHLSSGLTSLYKPLNRTP